MPIPNPITLAVVNVFPSLTDMLNDITLDADAEFGPRRVKQFVQRVVDQDFPDGYERVGPTVSDLHRAETAWEFATPQDKELLLTHESSSSLTHDENEIMENVIGAYWDLLVNEDD